MEYDFILKDITESSKNIFGEKLVGVYLHGSWAMGCFNPNKSDIDLIFVINNDLNEE